MALTTGTLLIFTILISVTTNSYSLNLFDTIKSKKIENKTEEKHLPTEVSVTNNKFSNNDRWIHKDFNPQQDLVSSPSFHTPWFLPWKSKRDYEYENWPKRRFPSPMRDQNLLPSLRAVSPLSASLIRKSRGRQYDVPQIECPPAEDGMERFACPTPDHMGRYRCIDDHVLCDGFIDCPTGEDEDRQNCMFYKTTKAHLDVLADALLRWARGR